MKKILISLSIIGVVAAIGIGATIAYFNDVETSTGNIFVAGALDLKVDHVKQTYNDVDCKTCSVEIESDITNEVTGQVGGIDPGPFPHNAVLVSLPLNPAWTASIPGASWIWWTDPTPEAEKGIDTIYTFRKTFVWMGPISGATLSLATAADNGYEVWLNGVNIGSDPSEQNYNAAGQDLYTGFAAQIIQGTNTLEIKVKNMLRPAGQTWDNPGGLLYKLTINGNCGDDYFKKNCTLWGEKDLAPGDHFFNFTDVKPGDRGTNVISLHSFDNDAWACLIVDSKTDAENDITNSESKLADAGEPGELSQYIKAFGWTDNNKNGVYEPGSETQLFSGSLADPTVRLAIADSTQGSKLIASNPVYVGLAWCAGTQIVAGDGTITCDGAGMGDIAQSDSLTADVTAYIEQWRNNGSFDCDNVNLP